MIFTQKKTHDFLFRKNKLNASWAEIYEKKKSTKTNKTYSEIRILLWNPLARWKTMETSTKHRHPADSPWIAIDFDAYFMDFVLYLDELHMNSQQMAIEALIIFSSSVRLRKNFLFEESKLNDELDNNRFSHYSMNECSNFIELKSPNLLFVCHFSTNWNICLSHDQNWPL